MGNGCGRGLIEWCRSTRPERTEQRDYDSQYSHISGSLGSYTVLLISSAMLKIYTASVYKPVEQAVRDLDSRQEQAGSGVVVLFLDVKRGEAENTLDWLDNFRKAWAATTSEHHPWRGLRPLPLIVVNEDNLGPEAKEAFLRWGVSSFVRGGDTDKLESDLTDLLAHAEALKCFDVGGRPSPAPEESPKLYHDVLEAFAALEKSGTERED